MKTTGKISEVRAIADRARADGHRVGLVPTMGSLHEGHRSLIRRARAETGFVVVSIFVNPAQFGPKEDLDAYPRSLAEDTVMCADEGADLVFHPDAGEMYPEPSLTDVLVHRITEPMEGAARPGHFAGVALVCTKLFNIVGPCSAYFGEKDAQQLRVVARLAFDLSMPVEVIACPTVRDDDGLALSSRNAYLSAEERRRALALPLALLSIEERVRLGEKDARALEAAGCEVLEGLAVDAVDYLEVVDPDSLERIDVVTGKALVCGAIRVGATRLIDNMTVGAAT